MRAVKLNHSKHGCIAYGTSEGIVRVENIAKLMVRGVCVCVCVCVRERGEREGGRKGGRMKEGGKKEGRRKERGMEGRKKGR